MIIPSSTQTLQYIYMDFANTHSIPWNFHGVPWSNVMECRGMTWKALKPYGISPWRYRVFHGLLRPAKAFHGNPLQSPLFHFCIFGLFPPPPSPGSDYSNLCLARTLLACTLWPGRLGYYYCDLRVSCVCRISLSHKGRSLPLP